MILKLPDLPRIPVKPEVARPSMMDCQCLGWEHTGEPLVNDHHPNCVHRSFVAYCMTLDSGASSYMYLGRHVNHAIDAIKAELESHAESGDYHSIEIVPYLSSEYEESLIGEFEGF